MLLITLIIAMCKYLKNYLINVIDIHIHEQYFSISDFPPLYDQCLDNVQLKQYSDLLFMTCSDMNTRLRNYTSDKISG